MPGPLALVGSGEFLSATAEVDRHLLAGRPGRVVHLATAAAEEGEESVGYWQRLAADHYAGLGVEVLSLPVIDAASAGDSGLAAEIDGAALVYLSGGNPGYLAATLGRSVVWEAIGAAWEGGTALAGCSAGAIALGHSAVDIRRLDDDPVPGLDVVAHIAVLPHFDRIVAWRPGIVEVALSRRTPGIIVLGIDEDTALVGGPHEWTVMGRQQAWLIESPDERRGFAAGATVHA
jgi:cyanophycinase-like exopeptidase